MDIVMRSAYKLEEIVAKLHSILYIVRALSGSIMRISIMLPEDPSRQDLLPVDVGVDMTVADLKAVIHSDTNILPTTQVLHHNGRTLDLDTRTLAQIGLKDNDILEMSIQNSRQGVRRQGTAPARGRGTGQPRQARSGQASGADPEVVRLQALGDPRVLQQIRQHKPELADAVSDPRRFRDVWETMEAQAEEAELAKQREAIALNADPFNKEAQLKIEESIRLQQVSDNLRTALDYTPEAFGRVHMLYIDCAVNSYPVKAFVDSGAQATIMSPDCADMCGITRLIDHRYAGIARGVGTAKIIGRVHSAQIKIGSLFLACSFTVMQGKDVDLLLGLDMLKRHQACIDLQKGSLVIQGVEVPFLGEADIPKHEEELANEPKVAGPGGMEIGGISGAVSQAGPSASGDVQAQDQAVGAGLPTSINTQSQGSSGGQSRFPQADIAQLESMGFTRDEAIQGLEISGGNVEMAAALLM